MQWSVRFFFGCPMPVTKMPDLMNNTTVIQGIRYFGGLVLAIITPCLSSFLYASLRWVVLCPALHPSVRRSICPSINFSCPLHNSDTVQDIFMKLDTNINHHQTMCREQEPELRLHFLRNYSPLKFFWWKSCPLNNFDTVQNIFMKLCSNINHHQTMAEKKNCNSTYIFME